MGRSSSPPAEATLNTLSAYPLKLLCYLPLVMTSIGRVRHQENANTQTTRSVFPPTNTDPAKEGATVMSDPATVLRFSVARGIQEIVSPNRRHRLRRHNQLTDVQFWMEDRPHVMAVPKRQNMVRWIGRL